MRNFGHASWEDSEKVNSKTLICWNCKKEIASERGFSSYYNEINGGKIKKPFIYICHHCKAPNIQDMFGNAIINPVPGKEIEKLPEDIKKIYNEARNCISVCAYTAAIMLFRKILMNIAVNEGAEEGKSFKYYLEYLCKEGCCYQCRHPQQV